MDKGAYGYIRPSLYGWK